MQMTLKIPWSATDATEIEAKKWKEITIPAGTHEIERKKIGGIPWFVLKGTSKGATEMHWLKPDMAWLVLLGADPSYHEEDFVVFIVEDDGKRHVSDPRSPSLGGEMEEAVSRY